MLSLLASLVVIGGAWWAWTVVRWVWLRPRAIEKCLRQQGLNGPPYKLLHGDMKQMSAMARHTAMNAKPIGFSDDFLPLEFEYIKIFTFNTNSSSTRRVYNRGENAENGDVQPYIDDFTSDVISRNAFGSSYEQGRRIYQLQKEQAMLTCQVLQSVYFPGRRFLPTKKNKRMKEIDTELKSILSKVMEKKERVMLSRESGNHEDLLSLLLKSTMTTNGNPGMSVDEAIEDCKSLYFAGQESSSNLLVWTMILLSQHQTWQTKAREDVHQVFGQNKPNYEGLSRLKVVTMILYEVLRLYSPGTIMTRTTYNETKLGELTVPAGVQFLLPIIFVHHDPEIWGKDAKEFNPERFSEGIAKATKNKLAFFPFSWGPRICIGNNFALMEAKLAISTILRNFSFELSPSYTHSPSYVVTLQPRYGAHLILHKI
ncbi:cytochrome P450 [Artemisia annua]|uniref:Cytochrome P450 n=1 Tax=Artemisia annua TaxID=35608 RepID=A0A2U1KAR3_ARTAN|nr:cytochrome P450 [Artemisia annua]